GALESIIAGREWSGPFKSLTEFCSGVDLRLANKRVVESLIRVGALRELGHANQLQDALDRAMALGGQLQAERDSPQLGIFGSASPVPVDEELPNVTEAPARERLRWEKELLGLYLTEHPRGG